MRLIGLKWSDLLCLAVFVLVLVVKTIILIVMWSKRRLNILISIVLLHIFILLVHSISSEYNNFNRVNNFGL